MKRGLFRKSPAWCGRWLLAGLLAVSAVQAQEIDEVVLIVNDLAVTQHEYSVLHYIQTQAETFSPASPDLDSAATQQIIDDLLFTAHARRVDPQVSISEAQVNEAIMALAARNQMTADQLLGQLQSEGVDIEIFKSSLKQRLLVQDVIGARVARSVNVSESEIKEYIDNRPELRNQAQSTYRVSHLVVSIADGQSRRQIKKLREDAEAIRARLVAGENFGAVAADYETASASGDKGDLGWRKQEELPELFVGALEDMQAGQISPILESSNGFHILSLTDLKSASSLPMEYFVRHIAKAAPPQSDARAQAQLLQNLKLQILAGLDFGAVARAESDDRVSAMKGGELGWIQLQMLDPSFAEAISRLEEGEIGGPVRSQYGMHLVQIMQSRPVPGAPSLEAQVQQLLFAEKLNEQMEDLLNDLKQVAYVEVVE